jgi:hypothetical protein
VDGLSDRRWSRGTAVSAWYTGVSNVFSGIAGAEYYDGLEEGCQSLVG